MKTCNSISSCGEKKSLVFKKGDYSIMQCEKCSHRFLQLSDIANHLLKVYSDDYFFNGGDGYPNYFDEKKSLYNYGARYARIISKYTKPGKMLDVGCAAGFIMKGFQDAGWDCKGVEPNDTMAGYGRKELRLDITTGSLESFHTAQKFDLINLTQVIGHFYDLDKAIQNIAVLLKNDGLVIVESWNRKSLFAKMMGPSWHEYSPPSVIHWFSDKTLAQFLNYYGFQLIAKGYPAKRISLKHATSLLEEKMPGFLMKSKMVKAINVKFGKLSLYYPPVDLKWYLFRKLK